METESHGSGSPSSTVPTANPLFVDEGIEDPSITLQQTEEMEDLLPQTATCFSDHDDESVRREDVLKGDEVEEKECLLQVSEASVQPEVRLRRYVNQQGNFITGIDVTSEEAAERRVQRAQRFGLSRAQPDGFDKLHERGKRFGTQAPVVNGELVKTVKRLPETSGGDVRSEAVYLYGTNEMSTRDVFEYFRDYGPSCVEWIDDSSCNAVWEDPTSARRALLGKGMNPVMTESEREEIFSVQGGAREADESSHFIWRLGEPHPRSKQLLLRQATVLDVKQKGAASRSHYYRKYGNPNLPHVHSGGTARKRGRQTDLRNRIERKRSSTVAADSEEEQISSSADERGVREEVEKEEEVELMEIDKEASLTLLSASKRPKTLYSDKRGSQEEGADVKMRIGKTWREQPPAAMNTATEKDLREKLKSKRKRKEIKERLGHPRLVTMDMS